MANQPSNDLCTSHLGACAELIAASWLLTLGYEVFRNVSGAGPADLSVWSPSGGDFHLIDVKSIKTAQRSSLPDMNTVALGKRHDPRVHRLLVIAGEVVGFFDQRTPEFLPFRYWPLKVNAPLLPPGYNENDSLQSPNTTFVDWDGDRVSLPDLARRYRIPLETLRNRLKLQQMSLAEALTRPIINGGAKPRCKVSPELNDALEGL